MFLICDECPIWEKFTLTIAEAARYFGIGETKIRQLVSNYPDADYILRLGNRKLIKRKQFEEMLNGINDI